MSGIDRERLRAALADKELTPRAASLAVGDNAYLVRDILSGKSKHPRADSIAKLASVLDVPLAELVTGSLGAGTPPPVSGYLDIRRRVQAGAWLAIDDVDQDQPKRHPAVPDPRFSGAPQWLSEVVGDSMNALHIYPGDLVHCVDATAIGYRPRTGDIVEVERVRHGGAEIEVTLKQVEVSGAKVELWPRSTNPRWKAPLTLTADLAANEDVEVRVSGFVIGAIRRFG